MMTLVHDRSTAAGSDRSASALSLQGFVSARAGRPFVVAQLGQSLDGRIATVSGESRWINGEAALTHLHGLRAAVDAVVVGVGTVVADDPQLNLRRVAGRNPARVVIDPNGRVPPAARMFAADGSRRILLRAVPGPVPEGAEEIVLPASDGRLSPAGIAEALYGLGFERVLVEGGATTVSRFIDAGEVDRLHILAGRVIIGAGPSGLTLEPRPRLADALRPKVDAHVLADGDVLFDCDLRASARQE
jgi:riboflavin-specific deaminase-like protein